MSSRLDALPPPLLVLGGVVSVQFGAAIAVTLMPRLGAGGAVLMRLGLGALFMLLLARPSVRGRGWRPWLPALAFGVTLGLMNFTFYSALARIPLGVAVTVEFLGPLLLSTVLSRRVRDVVAVAGALVGVVLISGVLAVSWSGLDHVGLGLATLAGAFWAAYIVLSGRTGSAFPGVTGLTISMVVAGLVVLPFGAASLPLWSGTDLVKGVGVALLSSVLPYSLELIALRRMTAQVFGILMSVEPAVGALAGFLALGQRLAPVQLVGMALVVAATAVVMGSRRTPPEPTEGVAELG